MSMRTWVTAGPCTRKRCRVSGCRRVLGSSSTQSSPTRPVSDAQPGAFPLKWLVSSSAMRTTPSAASWTEIQSLSSSRRRAVSQPSPITCAKPGEIRFVGDE